MAGLLATDNHVGFNAHIVPQPKPTYAPDGYTRCRRCNRLVKNRTRCRCLKDADTAWTPSEVRTTHMDAADIAPTREEHAEWWDGRNASYGSERRENATMSRAKAKQVKPPTKRKSKPQKAINYADGLKRDYRGSVENGLDQENQVERVCVDCGTTFLQGVKGRPAQRCQQCRDVRRSAQWREKDARRRAR